MGNWTGYNVWKHDSNFQISVYVIWIRNENPLSEHTLTQFFVYFSKDIKAILRWVTYDPLQSSQEYGHSSDISTPVYISI